MQNFKFDFGKKALAQYRLCVKSSFDFITKISQIIYDFFRKYVYLILLFLSILLIPLMIRSLIMLIESPKEEMLVTNQDEILAAQNKISKETKNLEKKLIAKTPKSFYLVINSASNEFSLYKGFNLIKTDKCSTGSYILLKNDAQQEWMFKTPKGEFRILGKTTSPVWRKPDWAFIEEGLPVPSSNHHTRYEAGVLGDFALSLGDGYLIHGTLYQRFLGLPVTHGCIRLNDANLELVYNSLSHGSKVYIY